jgi:hypothetical protein
MMWVSIGVSVVLVGVVVYAVLRDLRGKVPTEQEAAKNNNVSVNLANVPREGLVVVPAKSYMNKNGDKKLPSTADNVSDSYQIYIERQYTVKVPIMVDVKKPEVWTSEQAVEDKPINGS